MSILIDHCDVLDPTAPRSTRANQSILIVGARIQAIGAPDEVALITPPDALRVDGRHMLAAPGLISAHTHSAENFLRGYAERMPLEPWLVWMIGQCGEYTARDHYLAAMMSSIEMLLSGCTGLIDHYWHSGPWNREVLDAGMLAYRDIGIRATVAPLYDDSDFVVATAAKLGFDISQSRYSLRQSPDPAIRHGVLLNNLAIFDDWMGAWHGQANGRLQTFLGPAAGQLLTADCLHRSLDQARKHGAGIQMHCLETRVQDYCIRQTHGCTQIEWMDKEGLLGPDVTLPHSVWIRSEADLDRLARSGAVPVHNPAANLKLGSGLMPMREMIDHGVTVALGVDGACSNDNQNMFETVKLAALIHNLKSHDPKTWISAREAFEAGSMGGAAAMLHKGQLGELKPGQLADVVLLDTRSPTLSPMNDAYEMLAYCEVGGSVTHVIVNGEVVVKDGILTTIDVAAIAQEYRERVDAFPFRHEPPPEVARDMDAIWAFWRDVMQRVDRGE